MENSLNLNSNNQPQEKPFEQVIKEASENVQSEIAEKQAKKRGRKPKNPEAKAVTILPTEKQPELIKFEKAQYSMGIQMTFGLLGQYLSKAFKYDGFALSEEELKALGESGAECAVHFMPAVHPKWIALGGFTMTAGGIYAIKVVQYNEHLKQLEAKNADGVMKEK